MQLTPRIGLSGFMGAITAAKGELSGVALPFNTPVQATNNAHARQGKVSLNAQTLAVKVIQHIQGPELALVCQVISHKVHRPCMVCQQDFCGFANFA